MLATLVLAQTGNSFLSKIPDLPNDPCSMTEKQQHEYLEEINNLLRSMDNEISPRKKLIEKDVENSREEIEKNIAKQYGLSNADVQKLKNKKMSKEEKKAIADKMLQEKTGISMDEIEDLKNMSKEGKKAWVEGYSTQQMANTSPNPDGTKTEEQLEMEKDQAKYKKLFDLMQEKQIITDRIAASDKKFANRMIELEKEDSIQTQILKSKVDPLEKKLMETYPTPEEEEAIWHEIRQYEKNYCQKLSPLLMEALGESKTSLHKSMPDFKRLEEITAELNKTTMGINKDFSASGLFELQAVNSYVHLLLNTFKYKIDSFPDPTGSID